MTSRSLHFIVGGTNTFQDAFYTERKKLLPVTKGRHSRSGQLTTYYPVVVTQF